jgi:hypothetical protein
MLCVGAVISLLAGCKKEDDDPTHTVVIAPESPDRAPEGMVIPRSMADKGTYYLLEEKRSGGIVKALHKRVGVESVGGRANQLQNHAIARWDSEEGATRSGRADEVVRTRRIEQERPGDVPLQPMTRADSSATGVFRWR